MANRELILQAECFQWHNKIFYNERGLLRRIKNELDSFPRKTKQQMFAQLMENNSSGIVRGTPDFMYLINPMSWIEMKIDNGVQSEDQKIFENIVLDLGHGYYLARTFDEFKKLIYGLHC